MNLVEEIERLKKDKNAVILAHNYQRPAVQNIADYLGDSLVLARKATETSAKIILLAGVDFMAETACILNPDKKIIVPDTLARCPMAAMLNINELIKMKKKHPKAQTVLYVNTSAEAKAEADCVCTSANAPEIVNAMESDTIIFGPDRNLAYYVKKNSDKKLVIIPADGLCPAHHQVLLEDVEATRNANPDAELLVHPECSPDVQGIADHIASTEGIVKYARNSNTNKFIIGTEIGMVHRLKKEFPNKEFIPVSNYCVCADMKMNSLDKIKQALEKEEPIVNIPEKTRTKAKAAIDKMLELS